MAVLSRTIAYPHIAGRLNFSSAGYFAVLSMVVAVRAAMFVAGNTLLTTDSADYMQIASQPLYEMLGGLRPMTVSLVYKFLGNNLGLITGFQWLLSVVCWGLLAWMVARVVRVLWVRFAAFAVVLGMSMSVEVAAWDRLVMSESIALSLFALFVACLLWIVEGWSVRKAAALSVVAFLWTFARDTNAYLLLMLAGVLLLVGLLRRSERRYLLLVALFGLVFAGSIVSASTGRRWEYPLLNVIAQRVLPDQGNTAYFVERGMPATPALMGLSGGWGYSNDWAFYRSPQLEEFRVWLRSEGRGDYISFLLAHPAWAIEQPLREIRHLITPRVIYYSAPAGMHSWLATAVGVVLGASSAEYLLILGVVALGIAVAVGLFRQPVRTWIVPLGLIVLGLPMILLVWHADADDVERHALQVAIQVRLGVWLVLLAGIDRLALSRYTTRRVAC